MLCGVGLDWRMSLALMALPTVLALLAAVILLPNTPLIVTALDHLPSAEQAGTLAALMQGGGFLIAAVAPYVMARLIDWSGDYTDGWTML